MSGDDINTQVDEIRQLMETQMRVRGRSFEHQVHRAGRRLPRAVRRDAQYLAQVSVLAQNPKLARMVDTVKVDKAHAAVVAHLKTLDPRDRTKGKILNVLGLISLVLIAGFIAWVYNMWSRGLI